MSGKSRKQETARFVATSALKQVSVHGNNIDQALAVAGLSHIGQARDRAFARSLTYGALRWYHRLDVLLDKLLDRPLPRKHSDIRCLLLVGLYQLSRTDIPAHAVVSESVETAASLRKHWAKGLVNAVLRNYQRQRAGLEQTLDRDPVARSSHPRWLLDKLITAWPQHWQTITEANNQQAPMSLRVNQRRTRRAEYLQRLADNGIEGHPSTVSNSGIILTSATDATSLPGFAQGDVSVQDIAPQLAAGLLDVQPGMRVLDACAAPGGKSAHLLELHNNKIDLTAVDKDSDRAQRLRDNLERLSLEASTIVADAAQPDRWWDGRLYDRILLDAPCSGTGVIRRHPDIKLLRRPGDIDSNTALQLKLLQALWPMLAPGGLLLYATCSILPEENSDLVSQFLLQQHDAQERKIGVNSGHECNTGIQIFPGEDEMDGFYYACMVKT